MLTKLSTLRTRKDVHRSRPRRPAGPGRPCAEHTAAASLERSLFSAARCRVGPPRRDRLASGPYAQLRHFTATDRAGCLRQILNSKTHTKLDRHSLGRAMAPRYVTSMPMHRELMFRLSRRDTYRSDSAVSETGIELEIGISRLYISFYISRLHVRL